MAIVKTLIVKGVARFLTDAYMSTIRSGIWNGSTIQVGYGGTGVTSAKGDLYTPVFLSSSGITPCSVAIPHNTKDFKINGTTYSIFTTYTGTAPTIFAPTTLAGTGGYILATNAAKTGLEWVAANSHTHSQYVLLDSGTAEQTIKSSISSLGDGVISLWRATEGGYPMIGFHSGTTKTKWGMLGFSAANTPIFRNTSNTNYLLAHAGNTVNDNITVSWNAETTIATIAGIPIKIKIPANPDRRKAFYGTCDTASATAAKVVTLSDATGWVLVAGTIIGVKFTNTNSASNVTLAVNSEAAKSIFYNNVAYTGSSADICGNAGRLTYYMYDGTYWVYIGNSYIINSNTWRNIYTGGTSRVGTGTNTKAMNFASGNLTINYLAAGTSTGQSGNANYFTIKLDAKNWTGATSSAAGTAGYMPGAASADRTKFLRGDGSWIALAPSISAGTSDTNKVKITVGGENSSEFTIPYATNADKVDGYHENSFMHRWSADSSYFTKFLTFTRATEKGWLRFYVYMSDNSSTTYGGEYIVQWGFDATNENKTIGITCLYSVGIDSSTSVYAVRKSGTQFDLVFSAKTSGAYKIGFGLYGHSNSCTINNYTVTSYAQNAGPTATYTSSAQGLICNITGIADWAKLLRPIASTTTASASTWNIPSGSKQVWGEKFTDSTLTYTPAGGTATTITDAGDWVIWLTPSSTNNQATLNMRIDGTYYGSFNGNLTGNASTASKWQTARTLTIGNTGKSVSGSADVSWTLAEIGASATTHTHSVKINGSTKTIAAPGGTAVDLGRYVIWSSSSRDTTTKIYDIGCGTIFTGSEYTDGPVAHGRWMSGIALGSDWNDDHYQHYIVESNNRWYTTRTYTDLAMDKWYTFAYLSDIVANAVGVAGYVAAPTKTSNPNQVWMTNADGEPAWRTINVATAATLLAKVTKTLIVSTWTTMAAINSYTGTYAIQISSGNVYASGVFTACGGTDSVIDEIPLHVSDKGTNTWRPYARISGTNLQMTTNETTGTSREYTIKILKLI